MCLVVALTAECGDGWVDIAVGVVGVGTRLEMRGEDHFGTCEEGIAYLADMPVQFSGKVVVIRVAEGFPQLWVEDFVMMGVVVGCEEDTLFEVGAVGAVGYQA